MISIMVPPHEARKLQDPQPFELYQYCTLQQKDWLRVLVIEPSSNPNMRISCSLLHRPLTKDTQYEALSYTWGDEVAEYPIFIDGGVFRVRKNLYCALRKLRKELEPSSVWIDAICINQSDVLERGRQVAQMGSIYSMAEKVIVWLGEGDEHAELGMVSLHELMTKIEGWIEVMAFARQKHLDFSTDDFLAKAAVTFSSFLALSDSERRLIGIVSLYTRPWWERVWTMQEVVLAQKVEVHCGSKHVPWAHLVLFATVVALPSVFALIRRYAASSQLGRAVVAGLPGIPHTAKSIEDMQKQKKSGELSLSRLVQATITHKATDPRDKIYGLLGMVAEVSRLEPNYTFSKTQGYTLGMKAMLKGDNDLRGFGFITGHDENIIHRSLPSWVPDFENVGKRRTADISGLLNGDKRIYSASPLADECPRFSIRFEENDTLLHLVGVSVDVLDCIGDLAPSFESVQLGHILNPEGKLSFQKTVDLWKSSIPEDLGSNITGETTSCAFWTTLAIDQKVVGYHTGFLDCENERHSLRLDQLDKDALPADRPQEERMVQSLEMPGRHFKISHLANRRFTISKKGYFGLAPPTAQKGDVICVLLGGEVPYILRPLANGRYWILGEWYVSGGCTFVSSQVIANSISATSMASWTARSLKVPRKGNFHTRNSFLSKSRFPRIFF
jgi:hypothetical protein